MGRGLSSFHANDFRLSLLPGRPHSLGRLVQALCGSQPKADRAWCQTLWAVVSADGLELSFVGALRAAAQSRPGSSWNSTGTGTVGFGPRGSIRYVKVSRLSESFDRRPEFPRPFFCRARVAGWGARASGMRCPRAPFVTSRCCSPRRQAPSDRDPELRGRVVLAGD